MVELAFPILVIKTFNNWLLKFIGNLVSVLSVVVPHCSSTYSGDIVLIIKKMV